MNSQQRIIDLFYVFDIIFGDIGDFYRLPVRYLEGAIVKPTILGVLAILLGAGGCIIRPAAETILTLRQPDNICPDKSVMGLRQVFWSKTEGEILIIGTGWHPREHETYVFFINEPYPAVMGRSIRITPESNHSKAAPSWKVELLLDKSLLPCEVDFSGYGHDVLYVGTTSCRTRTFLGKLFLNLQDVKLIRANKPAESLMLSGRIAARKKSTEELVIKSELFDFGWQIDPDKNPNLIWEEDAAVLFDIPKSVLLEASRKKTGEPGYIWSCSTKRGMVYRKKDVERLAEGLNKLK